MNAIIRFPSKEAGLGLYNDPDYQEVKRIRQASTRNISMVLAQEIPTEARVLLAGLAADVWRLLQDSPTAPFQEQEGL